MTGMTASPLHTPALWITASAYWLARRRTALASIAFVLAVTAKLLPIVLAPLFLGRVRVLAPLGLDETEAEERLRCECTISQATGGHEALSQAGLRPSEAPLQREAVAQHGQANRQGTGITALA